MISLLAYIPFLDPINAFHDWWYLLLLPLSFGISVIYKGMRMWHLERFWREVTVMTIQIVAGMIALAIGLALFVQLVIPLLPMDGYQTIHKGAAAFCFFSAARALNRTSSLRRRRHGA